MMASRTISIILIVSIVLIFVDCASLAGETNRSKRSDQDKFILHSCSASVVLIRKHRNQNGLPKDTVISEKGSYALNENNSLLLQRIRKASATNSSAINNNVDVKTKDHSTNRRKHGTKSQESRTKEKNVRETPLATIDIKTIFNDKPNFRKKDPLPVLERNISGRTLDHSSSIIVIKTNS